VASVRILKVAESRRIQKGRMTTYRNGKVNGKQRKSDDRGNQRWKKKKNRSTDVSDEGRVKLSGEKCSQYLRVPVFFVPNERCVRGEFESLSCPFHRRTHRRLLSSREYIAGKRALHRRISDNIKMVRIDKGEHWKGTDHLSFPGLIIKLR
jgi:hypothetical protein